ncbi:MAG: hypothetical protein AMS26_07845 [Bacteroides sp. SM23_62]|nr:MAG: hypothetical protein AMS26_07845 [Bacteroides sp. SM23_62]
MFIDPLGNISSPAKLESVEDNGYCVRFSLEQKIDPESDFELILSDWPEGMNGMIMTSWASVLRVSVKK